MIRKPTWILLAVFIVLLGAVFYLQKNPLPEKVDVTPSPTARPKLLGEWQSSDIRWIEVKKGEEDAVRVSQDSSGNWVMGIADTNTAVEAGKIEAVRSEMAEALVQAALPADYDLAAIGLDEPAAVITIKNQSAEEINIQVGKETPTGTGYYVKIGQQAPVVVSKAAIDSVFDQVTQESLAPELTPTESQPTTAP